MLANTSPLAVSVSGKERAEFPLTARHFRDQNRGQGSFLQTRGDLFARRAAHECVGPGSWLMARSHCGRCDRVVPWGAMRRDPAAVVRQWS